MTEFVIFGIALVVIILLLVSLHREEVRITQDTKLYGHCEVCGGRVEAKWKAHQADKKTGKVLRYKLRVTCQSCGHWQRIEKYCDTKPE